MPRPSGTADGSSGEGEPCPLSLLVNDASGCMISLALDVCWQFDRDSRAVRDASGAVVARSLAHDQNRRMYMLALTTAQELVACRG